MTPRTLLVAELRETVNPVLKSWGFANPPRGSQERLPTTRLQAWWRAREGYRDEIYFSWTQRDPTFWIEVRTDQPGRLPGAVARGLIVRQGSYNVVAVRPLWGLIDLPITSFETGSHRPDPAPLALRRLEQINHFLLTGEDLKQPRPGFWDGLGRLKSAR